MSGYALAVSSCGNCRRVFGFNPKKVPSLDNIPFCRDCVEMANPIRILKGLPEIIITDDTYGPIPEEEL